MSQRQVIGPAAAATSPLTGHGVVGLVSTWRAIGRHLARRNTWARTERPVETPA